jgi:hypothetical protein
MDRMQNEQIAGRNKTNAVYMRDNRSSKQLLTPCCLTKESRKAKHISKQGGNLALTLAASSRLLAPHLQQEVRNGQLEIVEEGNFRFIEVTTLLRVQFMQTSFGITLRFRRSLCETRLILDSF